MCIVAIVVFIHQYKGMYKTKEFSRRCEHHDDDDDKQETKAKLIVSSELFKHGHLKY